MPLRRISALLLATTALTGCTSFVTGMGSPAEAGLEGALTAPVEGFEPAEPGFPPAEVCRDSGGTDDVPEVDPALGDPIASARHQDGEAGLGAWAWRVSSPERARDFVDDAVGQADDCEYDYFADYDEDGDGDIDHGASVVASASSYEGFGWSGLEVGTEQNGTAVEEVRYVAMDDVVLLVQVSDYDRGRDVTAVAEAFLETAAGAL
ncbi:hypothetical protein ACI8AF_11505 [Blastococcus sp. SYSU D00669]